MFPSTNILKIWGVHLSRQPAGDKMSHLVGRRCTTDKEESSTWWSRYHRATSTDDDIEHLTWENVINFTSVTLAPLVHGVKRHSIGWSNYRPSQLKADEEERKMKQKLHNRHWKHYKSKQIRFVPAVEDGWDGGDLNHVICQPVKFFLYFHSCFFNVEIKNAHKKRFMETHLI